MADRPILLFSEPALVGRRTVGGGGQALRFPTPRTQVRRIGPRIDDLERQISQRQIALRTDVTGVVPEEVLVLETVGRLEEFWKAVEGIPGLEWLADQNVDDIEPGEGFAAEDETVRELPGRVYLAFGSATGLEQLRRLWQTFEDNPESPAFRRGRTKWRDLFRQLRTIRFWNAEDRLRETGLLEDYEYRLSLEQVEASVEVELWFRNSPDARAAGAANITALVERSEGHVTGQTVVPEISYHGMAVRLPLGSLQRLVDQDDALVQSHHVMKFRPLGQAMIPIDEVEREFREAEAATLDGEPFVGMLDGLPVEGHAALAGRLVVDDPDNWSATTAVAQRAHGTSIASVILHGDIGGAETPLTHPLYVRPLLRPDEVGLGRVEERIPESILPVDLVHSAVLRIREGEDATRRVRVINHAVADRARPYDRTISAWARLLDHLSWRYRTLFIVSAGNHDPSLELGVPRTDFATLSADPDRLSHAVLESMNGAAWRNRLLSPAEAINVITVGAQHSDTWAGDLAPHQLDVLQPHQPSPVSAQGPGYRRSLKPEIAMPGGRVTYREKLGTAHAVATIERVASTRGPGQRTAAPSATTARTNEFWHQHGTSVAAARATNAAGRILEMLGGIQDDQRGAALGDGHLAVLTKALLVHSAARREPPASHELAGLFRRSAGYGACDVGRVLNSTDYRVTLVGWGDLFEGQANRFGFRCRRH